MANPNPEPHPENLKPFQAGQSGNPDGSSKKQRFRTALTKLLDDGNEDESLMKAAIDAAKARDFQFWKYLYELYEGKMPDLEPPKPPLDADAVIKRAAEIRSRRKKAE